MKGDETFMHGDTVAFTYTILVCMIKIRSKKQSMARIEGD